MDFQDVERQTEKRLSKIAVGELNMANEELFEVKRKRYYPYFPMRTQKQSWNTPFFCSVVFIWSRYSIPYRFFVWLTRIKFKNVLGTSRNDDSFVGS